MLQRTLDAIEKGGNRLPNPTVLFFYISLAVLVCSAIFAVVGAAAINPVSGELIQANNLLSVSGLHRILTETVENFVSFAPVGSVLVAMLGVGIAESSGLLAYSFRRLVLKAPQLLLTPTVIFTGVLSSIAMDLGYVVLIPLAAMVFKAAGRHPLIGIAAAFAGVSGGFSANLLVGPVDVILAGLSEEAMQTVANGQVSVLGNYYFMVASTLLVTMVGTLITEKTIAPRFEVAKLEDGQEDSVVTDDEIHSTDEARALKYVAAFTAVFIGFVLIGLIPADGFLRTPEQPITRSPFILGIVTIITMYLAGCGIIFGKVSGQFQTSSDIVDSMEGSMRTMASYLVLMFFAAQFVAWFNWSNLGSILAITGADLISNSSMPIAVIVVLLILFSALINLFVGSSSAKWALLAPIFIPMFYLNGISPEGTQLAYRIGDSVTNIITPLMPYFGVVIAFSQKYKSDIGIGTLAAMMVPYSIALLISWSFMACLWILFSWQIGPGVEFLLQR